MPKAGSPKLPRLAPTWPGVLAREFRHYRVFAVTPNDRHNIRMSLANIARRGPEFVALMRRIAERIGFPAHCPRIGCQRAAACADRYVACAMENREVFVMVLRRLTATAVTSDGEASGGYSGGRDG